VAEPRGAFWDDLAKDLEDPEFLRHFILESERIASVDRLMNMVDDVRRSSGLTKADLARAIQRTPATIRRLLTAGGVNPQLGVVAEMAAALGYRVTLEPMTKEERRDITERLFEPGPPASTPVR
jgi:DNA-binding phage protein